jgi:putative NADH-flavin reductase
MTPQVLAILGGTGSVGREVVRQAVMAGHAVNLLSRSRARVSALNQPVTFIDGDATDAATVDRAIAPADAVISTLGHTRGGPSSLLQMAATHAVAAMERHDVQRIVALSNLSVRSPQDNLTTRQQWTSAFARLSMRSVQADHKAQARVLMDSELEWTIVRTPLLVDRGIGGKYRVGALDATTGAQMGRADLAAFLLACAVEGRYVHQMPVVSQDPPGRPA